MGRRWRVKSGSKTARLEHVWGVSVTRSYGAAVLPQPFAAPQAQGVEERDLPFLELRLLIKL